MQHFGLLGAKLGHSLSPQIHGMIFEELGIDADYKLLELPAEALKQLCRNCRKAIQALM